MRKSARLIGLKRKRANDAYEAYRARGVMKDGRRFGGPPMVYKPPELPSGNVNVTDPDSQLVKTRRGWIQGYNAQAACNEDQIVIAAEIRSRSPDFGHLEPIVDAVETELVHVGVGSRPEVVLADAGYWHQLQMERIVSRGTQLLIPPDSRKREEDVMQSSVLLDCAGRRRSPAPAGLSPRGARRATEGLRYPPEPPTVEEIIA
jgi:hypothetical protein